MADTYTTNLSLTKPDIGGSDDTWGNKTNDNWDVVDAIFPSGILPIESGGTGASDAESARFTLGLGSLATQNSSSVSISGGTANLSSATVSAGTPHFSFNETDAITDAKRWGFYADGQALTLRLYNDALSSYGTALTVSRTGTSPSVVNVGTTLQVSGNVAYHAGNISTATITEAQIADGAALARVAGTEAITGTWTFSTVPTKASAGKFLHYASDTQNSGAVTVSTSAASGTPGNGDLWIRYA